MNETEKRLDDIELSFIKNEIEKEKKLIKTNFESLKIKFIYKIIDDLLIRNYLKFDNDQFENIEFQIEEILK